jgi:hypothetical protein
VAIPTSLTIDRAYGTTNEYSIFKWDERHGIYKAHCLVFGDLVTSMEIEDSLGIDTGIVPIFWGNMLMKNHINSNGIWSKTVKIMKAKVFDKDFQILDPAFRFANVSPNISHFFAKT